MQDLAGRDFLLYQAGGRRLKYSGIGGQAVLEGIMMKNKDSYAVAVRKPDGEIEIDKNTYVSMTERVKLFSLPFVRGIFSFADSMILGMRTLTWSASFFEDEEDGEEPGRFEKFLTDRFGEKLENAVMAVVMVVSVFLAIGIFMVLPLLIAGFFRRFVTSDTVMAILEGAIRIGIFIAYIKVISGMDEIKRTFMYHGSEHKCINCLEHGLVLNVENVQGAQTLRDQFPFDCNGNQHSVFYGGTGRYDMAQDCQPHRTCSGDCRGILRSSAARRAQ